MLNQLKEDLLKLGNSEKAKILSRFFKTGKGEYGDGDVFLGIKVPEQRKVAKKYLNLSLEDIQKLLSSEVHEHRLTSLFILIDKYKKSDDKKEIFDFYLKNTKKINNWDLVDLSAGNVLGNYLLEKDKSILYELAKSDNLWEKRIAIISTFAFIRDNKFEDTLKISELLLNDKHDLIHKAVGWMLREIGKRDQEVEEGFLKKYYKKMPRTMLRYSIEKFDEDKRKGYLNGEIKMKKVFCWGTFDKLHEGHRKFLENAKSKGDHLTVIVISDKNAYKNKGRFPEEKQKKRIEEINKISIADEIICASDNCASNFELIIGLKPDIFVFGYDQEKKYMDKIKKDLKNAGVPTKYFISREFAGGIHTSTLRLKNQ